MSKTILITGATDGIGFETAKMLAANGNTILLHGRNESKLQKVAQEIGGTTESYIADMSSLKQVDKLAQDIRARHTKIDVVINNAGVLKTPIAKSNDGLDIRFMVNTIAPYALTKNLLPIMEVTGRVINLSSAAQAPVDIQSLLGHRSLDDMAAYAQSKLAITIWTQELAKQMPDGPVFIAVNPGSLLASKMVKEGFGIQGNDLSIGAEILCQAALSPKFEDASGQYFDNDIGRFGAPDASAKNEKNAENILTTIEDIIEKLRT